MQGQITASTAVVLTDGARLMEPVAPPLPCRPLHLCVSDFAHSADGLGGGGCLLDSPRLLSSGLCGLLQALEGRVEVKVLDAQRHLGVDVDVDSHVFVSRQLLLQLGLFNHEWVRLWRSGGSTHRLVSVLVLDQIQSPEAQKAQEDAFISPTLWFNMTQGEPVPERSCTLKMKVEPHTHWQRFFITLTSCCSRGWLRPLLWLAAFPLRASAAPFRRRSPTSFTFSQSCCHGIRV